MNDTRLPDLRPIDRGGNALRHLSLAIRTLLHHRATYGLAIAILALGMGVSVAIFSLVDAVLLRPLPFPDQDRIQVIWKADPRAAAPFVEMAYPELRDLQQNIRAFQYVAVMPTTLYGYGKVLQTGSGEPAQIESAPVSHDFFHVLGVAPAIGRDFQDSDEHIDAPPVTIVSDWVWRQYLGSDRRVIGRVVRLNGQGTTIIGVMAPGVAFPLGAGLWTPLGVDRRVIERRTATFLQAIARVRPGYSTGNLRVRLNTVLARLAADHPDAYTRSQQAVMTPLPAYWAGSARLHLWVMLAASLLLFLAGLVSAANLFLSRALSRRLEIATRAALGARATQILAQFVAEGAAAGILAAGGGLLIAQVALRVLVRWSPGDIPRLQESGLHLASFGFAAAAALLAAIFCSVLPGWFIARADLEPSLRGGGPRLSGSPGGGRMQHGFILAQSAATLILLAMAGLLVTSYRAMLASDTGFANRDAISMNVALRGPGVFAGQAYDLQARRAFYSRLLERLRQSPGVISAAAVLLRPFEGAVGWDVHYQFEFENGRYLDREPPQANFEVVTPEYFQTVGTPLLEGRDFNLHDNQSSEPVVIISDSLARRIRGAGREPAGSRLRLGRGAGAGWMKVIGVCASARYRGVTEGGDDIYVPYLQSTAPTNYVVIRGARSAGELSSLVRRTVAGLDANQAVAGVASLGELIDRNLARHRFNMTVLIWFGACALALAAGGVYSVIAQCITARGREIAIRAALGAGRARLLREIAGRTMLYVLAGEAVGAAGAAAIGTLGSNLLYRVSARDPAIFAGSIAFLFAVSLAAALYPAWISAGQAPDAGLRQS